MPPVGYSAASYGPDLLSREERAALRTCYQFISRSRDLCASLMESNPCDPPTEQHLALCDFLVNVEKNAALFSELLDQAQDELRQKRLSERSRMGVHVVHSPLFLAA